MWGKRPPRPDREARLAASAARLMVSATPRESVMSSAREPATPRQKEELVRSEPYRRLVASMPCVNCGLQGYSQHAHENNGKGKGMKVCDLRAMPLCCTRPGVLGCHAAFDQYKLFNTKQEHVDKGREWAEHTQREIYECGLWPKNIKVPEYLKKPDERY